jgi:hypothetical protein
VSPIVMEDEMTVELLVELILIVARIIAAGSF